MTSLKGLLLFALPLFAATTLIVEVARLSNFAILQAAVPVTLLGFWLLNGRQWHQLIALFLFTTLLLSYLWFAKDVAQAISRSTFLVWPICILIAIRRFPKWRRPGQIVIFLCIVLGTNPSFHRFYQGVTWVGPEITSESESGLAFDGTESLDPRYPGIRYSELITRNFNFIGNRYDNNEFRVWTIFLLTKKYFRLIQAKALTTTREQILNSFPQGMEPISAGGLLRPKPVCSDQGYLSIDNIDGSSARFTWASPKLQSFTLPVLSPQGGSLIRGEGQGIQHLSVMAERKWQVTVILFWLPAVFLSLLLLNNALLQPLTLKLRRKL